MDTSSDGLGDDQLRVTCFHMGQGDATLIEGPVEQVNGNPYRRTILVDCGSSRDWDTHVAELAGDYLRRACPQEKLDVLILTHPDEDHHNRVSTLFAATSAKGSGGVGEISIDALYFSDHRYAYYLSRGEAEKYLDSGTPLQQYTDGFTNLYLLKAMMGRSLRLVHIDGKDNHLVTWPAWDNNNAKRQKTTLQNASCVVANGRSGAGTAWDVRLVAGSAREPKDANGLSAASVNAASIVTLVSYGNARVVIAGDATLATEAVVLGNAANKASISEVALLRAAHHGSSSSSGPPFVQVTSPQAVVVSVRVVEDGFRLPTQEVIGRFIDALGSGKKQFPHYVDGWVPLHSSGFESDASRLLDGWGVKDIKYVMPLEDSEKLLKKTPVGQWVAIGAMTWPVHAVLTRQRSDRDVWETSLDGANQFLSWTWNGT
jgi:beta-lactamase superfamily II metal-dependent hydrolase